MNAFCNPLNLEYKYQHYGKSAHREAADPTLIYFKGRYYLFASMSAGFYYSDDMINWQRHDNRNLELYHYAPDVRQVGDWLVFCASDRKHSFIWRTKDPFAETYEKVSEPFPFWDPDLFEDEDGRVYFYWGCDSGKPVYGIELNRETFLPIGERRELIFGNPSEHGFERLDYPGHEQGKKSLTMKFLYLLMAVSGRGVNEPFIEGAFMNKINGKYYLQYAAPATESSTYSDGVYIGETPLGPFSYQRHNPISSKPGGFITGAGHGSTIQDKYGNWWHTSTMRISVNASFERRIGLFPAGVDKDGILFCNQNFADWPVQIPDAPFDPLSIKPEWMLVSYKKHGTASSFIEGHEPALALDENIRTCWCSKGSSGEWYSLDLGDRYSVYAVQINFADVDVPIKKVPKNDRSDIQTNSRYIDSGHDLRTRWKLEGSNDGSAWHILTDKQNAESDLANDCVFFECGESVRYLRLTATELPYGKKFAISGLRVFSKAKGASPSKVKVANASCVDDTTVSLSWPKVENAIGYNIRYGIAPDKLYSSHLVYNENHVLLTLLNKGQEYFYSIDSFGEGGITEGEVNKLL